MSHPRPSFSEVGDLVTFDEVSATGNAFAKMTILHITSLSLSYFRNHLQTRFELSPAPVVMTGANGSGKTSVLEAVSMLAPGRGLRKAKLSELSHVRGGQPWVVSARGQGRAGEVQIGTGLDPQQDERRVVRINSRTVRGHSELTEHLAMLWLTPQIEQLFQEGSSAERKFMDRLVYGFDPAHAARVQDYEQTMRERNRLLQDGRSEHHWLAALEQSMAEKASAIAASRLEALEHINRAMMDGGHSFPKAHLTVSGWLEDRLCAGDPAVATEQAFAEALAASRMADAGAGRALLGTHRSQLNVLHLGKHMPAGLCSTGEQKAVLLSIVLAQARASMHWKRLIPILLLDEVATHLDSTRRLELFEEICQIGAQVWMTGTDAALFDGLGRRAQYFRIEEGKVFHSDTSSS